MEPRNLTLEEQIAKAWGPTQVSDDPCYYADHGSKTLIPYNDSVSLAEWRRRIGQEKALSLVTLSQSTLYRKEGWIVFKMDTYDD